MNKPWSILILSLVLVFVAGCRSNYTIIMRNGGRTVSKGKPKLIEKITVKHEDTGKEISRKVPPYYHFTEVGGRTRTIPQSAVIRIYPTSDSNHQEVYYNPTDYQKPKYWDDKKWNKQPWYKRL